MFKKTTHSLWIALFLFMMVMPAYGGMLDGKTFIGKNGEVGKNGSEADTIKFMNGKFLSVGCAEYGFGEADYTTRVDGDKIFFTADIYSDKYGRITYTGMVKGNDLSATFIWFDKDKYAAPEQVKWWKGRMN